MEYGERWEWGLMNTGWEVEVGQCGGEGLGRESLKLKSVG